jgi:hypothetical protein
MRDVFDECKKRNIPSVGYHLDLFKGIKREIDLQNDPYWNIEYFFTVDRLFVDDLKKKGIKAYYLPAGVLEDECNLHSFDNDYKHDIIFTGSRGYHSEYPYRSRLIDWLMDAYKERFKHYGGDGIKVVRGGGLNKLYAETKIIIGDTLCKDFTYPYYLSDRFFEVPGRGGFMIFPYIFGADKFLEDRKEVVYYRYNDFEDLKNKIDYYIEHNREREAIRIAGHERVKNNHTYTQRLKHLLDVINNDRNIN